VRHLAPREAHASTPHQVTALGLTCEKADNPNKAHQHYHAEKGCFQPVWEGASHCLRDPARAPWNSKVTGHACPAGAGLGHPTTRIVPKERKTSDK
jgi:hypothetical protein